MSASPKVSKLKWTGLLLLAFFAAFNLLFAIGELGTEDYSGLIHLLPVILTAILAYLAWKWPLGGGILLILVGIIFVVKFIVSMPQLKDMLLASLLLAGPLLAAGVLFFITGIKLRKAVLHTG